MNDKYIRCSHCGREFLALDPVCPFCGAEAETGKKKRRRRNGILFVAILTLAAVLFITYFSEIRYAIWHAKLMQELKEDRFEDLDYSYYTISQEDWDALHQGDYCSEDHWEIHFSHLTPQQQKALAYLKSEVRFGISRRDALRKLQSQGYSLEDAEEAVDAAGLDWKKMALKNAYSHLSRSAYSEKGLVSQLKTEGYTQEEAQWAADHCGADWESQARIHMMELLETCASSYVGYLVQLEDQGYPLDQAEKAIQSLDIDWNVQAERAAIRYLEDEKFSRMEMIQLLRGDGFTEAQAVQGAELLRLD